MNSRALTHSVAPDSFRHADAPTFFKTALHYQAICTKDRWTEPSEPHFDQLVAPVRASWAEIQLTPAT